jgi:hypothetical protein
MISRSSVPHNRTLYRVAERPMPFGGLRGDGYEGALYGKEGRHVDRAHGERLFGPRSAGSTAV